MRALTWQVLAGPPELVAPSRSAPEVAAIVVPSRDRFADPPALAVRTDALGAVGGPEPVRAGALADLVDRLEAAGHAIERRPLALPPRRATLTSLYREGAGRFWLWRRRPDRHPLPRLAGAGRWAYPVLALGALHANGDPTPARPAPVTPPPSADARSRPAR